MTQAITRHLSWAACFNARDVGGYETGGPGRIRWGALVRADTPSRLTPASRQALVDYGVKTIVDLRAPWEAEKDPNPFADGAGLRDGIHHHLVPLRDDANQAAAAALAAVHLQADHYCLLFDHFASGIAEAIRAVALARPGGVLVHCHSGKDRTGVVVAMLLALVGVPRPVIAEDYALSEAQLQPFFEGLYPTITDPIKRQWMQAWSQSRPETMLTVFDHLDHHHGGVDAYVRAAGVTEGEIARLRERLLEAGA